MTAFDYQDKVSDLYIKAGTAHAITTAFANQFVDNLPNDLSVRAAPEQYEFLFHALSNAVYEIYKQAKELNETRIAG